MTAKKPTALRKLQGNPSRRPFNENEPQPDPAIPTCPAHLDSSARTEWRRISKELLDLGLLTNIDRSALAAYCVIYGRWVEAENMVRKHGMVVKTPNGGLTTSPFLWTANKCLEQMLKYMTEFGLTPVSRSRVSAVAPPKERNPILDIMDQAEAVANNTGFGSVQ
jgi:P27 family predicted phage terminase small subunit